MQPSSSAEIISQVTHICTAVLVGALQGQEYPAVVDQAAPHMHACVSVCVGLI